MLFVLARLVIYCWKMKDTHEEVSTISDTISFIMNRSSVISCVFGHLLLEERILHVSQDGK